MNTMHVFKFGGASVKDAQGVRNVATVLNQTQETNLVIVISAMGKTTNALEGVVACYFNEPTKLKQAIEAIKAYHWAICQELFTDTNQLVFSHLQELITALSSFLQTNKSTNKAYVYDQVVGYGELLSTTIVSTYLTQKSIQNTWIDIRTCIVTDSSFRDARVNWQTTKQHIVKNIAPKGITITQGFLAAEASNNFTTTLGREGSDYTAAILAYCLDAAGVTIWKDVPGVLNADPRYFNTTRLLKHISYREAIELAFYGASVIHPKTLQPLQKKEIPLFVKSFYDPLSPGTCVGKGVTLDPKTACFILKKEQILLSLSSLDFSFMVEKNISDVFTLLDTYKMKVSLIQNSAISFSVVIDDAYHNLDSLLSSLRAAFRVSWNENVTLYTIRHASSKDVKSLIQNKKVLLKQESRETIQVVIKD
ncbi:MAG: Lysine-sensitive aspartokinase 3 [Flavobacteriaceae bacterium]|nr:MAG: Lysine-sensitive aspartokinase 3 [Flavobacteriaceae bacterium]